MHLNTEIYDTHVHVWTLEPESYPWNSILAEAKVPDESARPELLLAEMVSAGARRAVLVQPSTYGWNHAYLLDVLDRYPESFVGVGLVDPLGSSAAERLEDLTAHPAMRGVRFHLLNAEQAQTLARVGRELFAVAAKCGLAVTLQAQPATTDVVRRLAENAPETTIVVDHLGLVKAKDWTSQIPPLLGLAPLPNVYVKLSGLEVLSAAGHPFEDCRPIAESVLEAFGPARVMWASNFPHVRRGCSYTQAVDVVTGWLQGCSAADRHAVLYGTAAKVWGETVDER